MIPVIPDQPLGISALFLHIIYIILCQQRLFHIADPKGRQLLSLKRALAGPAAHNIIVGKGIIYIHKHFFRISHRGIYIYKIKII